MSYQCFSDFVNPDLAFVNPDLLANADAALFMAIMVMMCVGSNRLPRQLL